MEGILRNGDVDGRYRSRSEMVQAIATAAVNAGWSNAELWSALCDPSSAAGDTLREKSAQGGEGAAWRWFARTWEKAVAFAAERPAAGAVSAVMRQVAELRQAASDFPWPRPSAAA